MPGEPRRVRQDRARGGQVLLSATFSLIFLFAVMGLSVDLGWAYFLKVRLQTAADAAATAAAVYAKNAADTCTTITCNVLYTCASVSPPTNSLQAGCLYVPTDGPPSFTATMIENDTTPPLTTGLTSAIWIKATVATSSPNFFLFGSGFHSADIAASAIAVLTKVPPTSCIYVLSPTGSGAFSMTGTASVAMTNCALYVNSNNGTALTRAGSSTITGTVNIVGGYSQTGSGSISPSPNTGMTAVADPLASLPAPAYSGCDYTNYSTSSGGTLNPGVYCGGISITGSSDVTLNSGTYIMRGGGFSRTGSGGLSGSHVMIYNTADATHAIGAVSVAGSGPITLSAPSAGTYAGVVFFQDRAYTNGASVNGSTTSVITGTLYFANADLTYTGSSTAQFTAIVSKTLRLVGSTAFKSDSTGTFTGLTVTTAALIQ